MADERTFGAGLLHDEVDPRTGQKTVGLFQKPDGSSWVREPDGTETRLPDGGGGGGAPSGPAGGVLGGTYPNPSFAVDMATQAEFDVLDLAAVKESDFDAKGDLLIGTANDAFDQLPVGTDGFVLTADSGETTGVKWEAPSGGGANLQFFGTTLADPTAIGDTTIDLTSVIPTITDLRAGAIVINPYTTNAEARRVTTVGAATTLTLAPQRSWLPQKTQIIASTKTFRWARGITSISTTVQVGSTPGVLTVVLDGALDIVVGDSVNIWDTTSFNSRYFGPVKTVSGDKLTFTFEWWNTVAPATETAGFLSRYSHRFFTLNFRPGETFKIVGSVAGNNGTYTVDTVDPDGGFITVDEVVPANENENNALRFDWDIQKVHSAGTPVIYVPDRRLGAEIYGLEGDGADENIQIQNMFWDVGGFNGWSVFSNGTYASSKRLIAPQQQIQGNGQSGTSKLVDLSTTTDYGAGGFLTNQATSGVLGAMGRLILRDMFLIGNPANIFGVGGVMNFQQPNNWLNVRISQFAQGLVIRGQQAAFYTLEIGDMDLAGATGTAGMVMETCILMNFYDLDIEHVGAGGKILSYPLYSNVSRGNRIYGFHVEGAGAFTLWDCDQVGEATIFIDGGWWSADNNSHKGMYYHPPTYGPGAGYTVNEFYLGGSQNFNFIDDVPISTQLTSYTFFKQHVNIRRLPLSSDSTQTGNTSGVLVLGPNGQQTMTGPRLHGSPLLYQKQLDVNGGDFIQFDLDATVDVFRVNKDGYLVIKKNAAIPDADLVAGELSIWFDQTNGAAKLMIKAKEAGGTVRTGNVALV